VRSTTDHTVSNVATAIDGSIGSIVGALGVAIVPVPADAQPASRTTPINFDLIMRVWDIHPSRKCSRNLHGEHRELHGLLNILVLQKSGYSFQPETKRWEGKLAALYNRHQQLVEEMERRGYRHHSPLDRRRARGVATQSVFIDSIEDQERLLGEKPCECLLPIP
jgi:hypothetical protein